MRVAYRGNFQPQVAVEDRWSTESQVAATLEQMGHRVLRLQEDAVEWDVLVEVAATCDVFLWTQTWNRDPLGGFDALKQLRDLGVPSVAFHLDLFLGLDREAKVREEPFFRCDFVFTADGGHDDQWQSLGVNHIWSPPAVFEAEAITGEPTSTRAAPVLFVGSYPYPHQEHARARAELVHFCQQQWRRRFTVVRGGVRGQALADLYASAQVVIGDSCLAGRIPRYWSDRVPETLGRRGFLIHPYIEGIEDHYEDGEHLRLFEVGDFFQLRNLVNHYLDPANDDERQAIAAAGQAHVRAHHTYRHRLERVLDVVAAPSLRAVR